MKYKDLDDAVRACLDAKRKLDSEHEHCKSSSKSYYNNYHPIYLGKSDAKSAFRLVPLSRESWPWLVMKAENPETGQIQYFVDKCLPFGASISCALFQEVLDALHYLIEARTKTDKRITNYLDDFLFVALTKLLCDAMITEVLILFEEVGVPISDEKTEWGAIRIVFLGILLDSEFILLAIPEEKRNKVITLLKLLLNKNKATVKELQTLCSYLNFLNKAIYPGHAFVRRMYARCDKIINQEKGEIKGKFKFRQYHHVRLDAEFKADCKVWLEFLTQEHLSKVVNRLMIDTKGSITAQQLRFYSDASASENLGFGCILDRNWIVGKWDMQFIKEK